METKDFIWLCKQEMARYFLNADGSAVLENGDMFVVWYCKTIQNHKALMSAHKKGFPFIEFTYNGDKDELYMDIYEKVDKKTTQWASVLGVGF